MFYFFLKWLSFFTGKIFFSKIEWSNPEDKNWDGPLVIACNHSNSFLDAIIVGTYFKKPVYFLARGDAFKPGFAAKVMAAMKMIPIYRIKEGRGNLKKNDRTFEICKKILDEKGIILIFSEGICVNEWNLRPLGKGTARIVKQALEGESFAKNVKILPMAINYSTFKGPFSRVVINTNGRVDPNEISDELSEAQWMIEFNQRLHLSLSPMVLGEHQMKEKNRNLFWNLFKNISLLCNGIYYLPIKKWIERKTKNTVFYDSILYGILMFTYPIYLGMIFCVLSFFVPNSIALILPVCAMSSAWLASKTRA